MSNEFRANRMWATLVVNRIDSSIRGEVAFEISTRDRDYEPVIYLKRAEVNELINFLRQPYEEDKV
jgi:hypothetical protein